MVTENTLIDRDDRGSVCRDEHGIATLGCTCGLVLTGTQDPLLTSGGGFWINDSSLLLEVPLDQDPRVRPRNVCIHEGYASMALIPIRDTEGMVGLIHLSDRRKGFFSAERIELLEGLATHIGGALVRKKAEEELRKNALQLEVLATERELHLSRLAQSLSSLVHIVSEVAEVRDPYTAGHQRRVAELAMSIAEKMGMPDELTEDLRIASLLHDIGKMSIPAEILTKPGKLLSIEFELIKGHAEAGYRIICSAELAGQAAEIVYQHHERCDGSGYPRGLKSGEILPAAKVLMVADVVEAMMSHRPYRPGLGTEKALEEIERGCGSQYDPRVSEACLTSFREDGFQFSAE